MIELPTFPVFDGPAACAESDPDSWFREGKGGLSDENILARQICRTRCEVRDQCLQWAMDNREPAGIWGGMTETERRKLRKRQQKRAA